MTLPHAAYAEAAHQALADAGLAPAETAVSVAETQITWSRSTVRDLSIALTWDTGLRLVWRHIWGWFLYRPDRDGDPDDLALPLMVDPAVLIAPVAAALAGRSGVDIPDEPALWAHHHTLDRELAAWEAGA